MPPYDKVLSVSIFNMKHNVPAVITNPQKPILLKRPGQKITKGAFAVVESETDQGLVLTQIVAVGNLEEVIASRRQFRMQAGNGDMRRDVRRFKPEMEKIPRR